MFADIALHATLPATDFGRAKAWYAEKLDLHPIAEDDEPGGAWYETGGARFLLYESTFAGGNRATTASFTVDDFPAAVAFLRKRGVTFEEYDFGDFKTEDGVLTLPDGNQGAWFHDSEGNILAVSTM
jgi:catechol 2,3-dioxygenase-like lactoylglutathione lyase family enzyme